MVLSHVGHMALWWRKLSTYKHNAAVGRLLSSSEKFIVAEGGQQT